MKTYYITDNEGYYLRHTEADIQPPNSTAIAPPQPMFYPRFDRRALTWIEERPNPGGGMAWSQDTKEWGLGPVEAELGPKDEQIAKLEADILDLKAVAVEMFEMIGG